MSGQVDLPAETAGWVDVLRAAAAEKARAEQVIAQARARIEEALGDAETGLVAGRPAVRWTTVASRRLDTKALKEKEPDLYEAFTRETVARRFTLVEPDA